MLSDKTLPRYRLSLFFGLSLLDLILTGLLLHYSGGRIVESNPIAGAWLAEFGWPGLVFYKVSSLALFTLVLLIVSAHRPPLARNLLTFGCAAVGAVSGYSYYLLNHIDGAFP